MPCHVSNIKGKGEDSKWSFGEQIIIQSKAHIPNPGTNTSQIPRDEVAKEGSNTDEEIERFTSIPKDTPRPSSQAQAKVPDHLDYILRRVEEMHAMLTSHIDYSMRQFTYLEGQITTFFSQIQDLEKLESKFDAF